MRSRLTPRCRTSAMACWIPRTLAWGIQSVSTWRGVMAEEEEPLRRDGRAERRQQRCLGLIAPGIERGTRNLISPAQLHNDSVRVRMCQHSHGAVAKSRDRPRPAAEAAGYRLRSLLQQAL